MISQLERQIVFRYLKTKKKDGFLNIISIFSFIGISLGVAVLIIVMSVMNGFRAELVDKIVGFNSHIIIQSNDIKNDLKLTNSKNIKKYGLVSRKKAINYLDISICVEKHLHAYINVNKNTEYFKL